MIEAELEDFANVSPNFQPHEWHAGRHENENANKKTTKEFEKYSSVCSQLYVTPRQQQGLWDNLFRNMSDPKSPCWRTLRDAQRKDFPDVTLHITLRSRRSGRILYYSADRFPRALYARNAYDVLAIHYYTTLESVADYHITVHSGAKQERIKRDWESQDLNIITGVDGVPHSVSSTKKMTLTAIKFTECRLIYPFAVMVKAKHFDVTSKEMIGPLVSQLREPKCHVKMIRLIADMPMRSFLLNTKQFNGFYGKNCLHFHCLSTSFNDDMSISGCEQCYAEGKLKEGGRGTAYPGCYQHSMRRDRTKCEEFSKLAEKPPVQGEIDIFGHKGHSELLKIPGFDPQTHLPSEPMHLIYGCVNKLLELMVFKPSQQTKSWSFVVSTRIQSRLSFMELPTEFQRSFSEMDMAHPKCQEAKCMLIFGFDQICTILSAYKSTVHASLFADLAYLVRILLMPYAWFKNISSKKNLDDMFQIWFEKFELEFGPDNCTANLHQLTAHLLHWRKIAPLGELSAEPFEDFYGKCKRRFKAGTDSEGTQMMNGIFHANSTGHFCGRGLTYQPYNPKNKKDDSIVFDYAMRAFQVLEGPPNHPEQGFLKVHFIETKSYCAKYSGMNWNFAGVFKVVRIKRDEQFVDLSMIVAKGVMINDNLVAVATDDMIKA